MVFTKAKTLIALFIFFFIQMACCNLFTTGVSEECHVDEFKKKSFWIFMVFFLLNLAPDLTHVA